MGTLLPSIVIFLFTILSLRIGRVLHRCVPMIFNAITESRSSRGSRNTVDFGGGAWLISPLAVSDRARDDRP